MKYSAMRINLENIPFVSAFSFFRFSFSILMFLRIKYAR